MLYAGADRCERRCGPSAAKLESIGFGVLIVITMMTVLYGGGGLNRGGDSGATHQEGRMPGMAESKANPKQICRLSTPFLTGLIRRKPLIRQRSPRPTNPSSEFRF